MSAAVMFLALTPIHLALSSHPIWHDDYARALKAGAAENRPLAVVLASGADGWKSIVPEGEPGAKVRKVLTESYVCVYVDTAKAQNDRLVKAFDAPNLPALVISDRRRDEQAFRHAGKLDARTLLAVLQHHSGPESATGPVIRSYYQPATPTTISGARTIQYCTT